MEGLDRPLEPNSILPQVLKRYTVMVGVCGEVNGLCAHLMGGHCRQATNALSSQADIAKVQGWPGGIPTF